MTVPFREAYKTKSSIVEHPNYPTGFYRARGKRFLDLIIIFASLPFVLPMIALLVLVVARDGGQPFFTQKRVGRHGRTFRMVKLRSMVPDAEAQLQAYLEQNPQAREEWNRTQKLKSDPRITRVGRFLRRSSLDELPQLWNVLKGDMSLIGPRPMMIDQVKLYPGDAYFSLRPGITGPWQVSERNETEFADRARFDSGYLKELSFRTDLNILVRTFGVVMRCTGY
ncbi:sugar transferase [Pseudooceanicola lipolyticus]|uniref:Sugar transferase n=1 Tax=Pseudooceanicola lipolyticus TaxID=2029104 RepID=A0A2M8J3S7_9RHOB|nr:sugar transferase [Pseudooceanicola lipolyticus]PJE37423.1 sugar transferase [Pseudooceanicola lipolyticus]